MNEKEMLLAHSHGEMLPTLLVIAGVDGAGKTSACGVWREYYSNILETALTTEELEIYQEKNLTPFDSQDKP